jgi:hypothetical protein
MKTYTDETQFDEGTPEAVKIAIESARQTGARVRLFLDDRKTGRDWGEENDVTGTIGRSTGPCHVALLLANNRSTGGGAILTNCIIRLLVNGREQYRAENYQPPKWEERVGNMKDRKFEVWRDNKIHARFETDAKRQRWIAFMKGERATK